MHVDGSLKSGHVLDARGNQILYLLGNDRDAVAIADHDEDIDNCLTVFRGDLHAGLRGRALDAEKFRNVCARHGRKARDAFDFLNGGIDHHMDNIFRNADIPFFRLAGDIVFRHSC